MFSLSSRRGLSLIEIMVGVALLGASLLPIYSLFSSGHNQNERSRDVAFANLAGHRILETIALRARNSLELKGHESLKLIESNKISPYFADFDGSTKGPDPLRYPLLQRDLKNFSASVEILPAPFCEANPKVRLARVSVFWLTPSGQSANIVLQTIVSDYVRI